jgi:hypothetical protein
MRRVIWIAALVVASAALDRAQGGEPQCCDTTPLSWLKRWHPVGGWDPDGGGLLRWWNPHCFPCTGGPNDYCRKPLPCVCWPAYPPYFQWGTPAENTPRACSGKMAEK